MKLSLFADQVAIMPIDRRRGLYGHMVKRLKLVIGLLWVSFSYSAVNGQVPEIYATEVISPSIVSTRANSSSSYGTIFINTAQSSLLDNG